MEFAAAASGTWETGRIMVTSGLNKVSMNDLLVELEEEKGERWACLLLAYTDGQEERIAIRPANLVDPPAPLPETLIKCRQLVDEHNTLLAARDFNAARDKLVIALTSNPASRYLHNIMGDLSHKAGFSPSTIVKYMRRAVANTDGTLGDKKRAFMARVGYSGALGNMNDLAGEQQQVQILIDQCNGLQMGNWMPTLHILYADSLRTSNKLDQVFEVLQKLDSLPRPFPTVQFEVEPELKRNSPPMYTCNKMNFLLFKRLDVADRRV
jgi:hypothetical protein